jgi:leader peptidase (prepilin peptidase) / N-methyltransferase
VYARGPHVAIEDYDLKNVQPMVDRAAFQQTGRRPARRWKGRALRCAPFLAALYICAALVPAGSMPPLILCASIVIAALLITLSAVDLAIFRIPDEFPLGLGVVGLATMSMLSPALALAHAGFAVVCFIAFKLLGLAYRHYRGHDGFGHGDTKLLTAATIWVGPSGIASILLLASATGLAHFLALRLAGKRIGSTSKIAFGPHIALGLWLVWLYGPLQARRAFKRLPRSPQDSRAGTDRICKRRKASPTRGRIPIAMRYPASMALMISIRSAATMPKAARKRMRISGIGSTHVLTLRCERSEPRRVHQD